MTDRKTQKPSGELHSDPSGRGSALHSDPMQVAGPRDGRRWWKFGQLGGLWDEPVEWAVSLPRMIGLRVRLHLFLLVFCLVQVSHAIWPPSGHPVGGDWTFTLLGLAALMTCLVLHEAAHIAVNRLLEGDADEVNFWPLGGLAPAYAPGGWHPNLLVFLAGPIVNLSLCLALTPILALWVTHDWWAVIFNPLDPASAYAQWAFQEDYGWWMLYLWWLNYASLILLIFNLLPMYPLDGAEILHWSLRASLKEQRAAEITTATGYVIATVLGIGALITRTELVLAVALLGGVVTWLKRRRIEFISTTDQDDPQLDARMKRSYDLNPSVSCDRPTTDQGILPDPDGPMLRLIDEEDEDRDRDPLLSDDDSMVEAGDTALDLEVDRILAKIYHQGMSNLSDIERATLDEASRRRKTDHPPDSSGD